MKIFLEMSRVIIPSVVLLGLTACSSLDNTGYKGGDHRGGGPAGAYGVPDAKTSMETSDKAVKKESTTQTQKEDVYTGGDHRGGGPHGPLG